MKCSYTILHWSRKCSLTIVTCPSLASCVVNFSWQVTCQVPPQSFKYHPSSHGCQIGPINRLINIWQEQKHDVSLIIAIVIKWWWKVYLAIVCMDSSFWSIWSHIKLYTIFRSHIILLIFCYISSHQVIMDSRIFSGNLKLHKYTSTCIKHI